MAARGQTSTPWGRALDAALADGKWHHRDEILAAASITVPPGVAFRRGDQRRRQRRTTGDPDERHHGDTTTSMRAGARDVARGLLHSRVQRRVVERDGDRYRRRVS